MGKETKEALIRAALSGELDSDKISGEFLSKIEQARDLTPEEEWALKEKVKELRASTERLREIWAQMGLR